MPTYEYRCEACGHGFEIFQSITEPTKRKCPDCSRLKLRRVIGSGAGVIFKGSGFYQTDYRSEAYRKEAKKEAESGTVGGETKGADGKAKGSSGEGKGGSSGGDGKPAD